MDGSRFNFESSCFISFLDFGHFRLVELNTGSSNFRLFFEFKIYILFWVNFDQVQIARLWNGWGTSQVRVRSGHV